MCNRIHSAKKDANGPFTWEADQKQKSYGPLWPDLLLEPSEGRRLRVGYLSADLCNHPVGRFVLPILKNHNREKVEVWGISCGPHHDWISEQLQENCEHWLDCRFLVIIIRRHD